MASDSKLALVTGASSGIGRELTLQLCGQGVHVIAVARREEKLSELEKECASLPGRLVTVAGDVTQSVTRIEALNRCTTEFGGVDLVINNAGTTAMGSFIEAEPERLRKIFEVNFFAIAEMTREAVPFLKSGNKPMIVNISSVLGHRAAPLKSEYCASKFAVHGFSDAVRAELVSQGIDLLLVSPSTTDSDFFEQALEDPTGKDWKKAGAMSPKKVAQKTLTAIRKGRHEIILSAGGTFIVWLDRLMPPIANRIIARFGQ